MVFFNFPLVFHTISLPDVLCRLTEPLSRQRRCYLSPGGLLSEALQPHIKHLPSLVLRVDVIQLVRGDAKFKAYSVQRARFPK